MSREVAELNSKIDIATAGLVIVADRHLERLDGDGRRDLGPPCSRNLLAEARASQFDMFSDTDDDCRVAMTVNSSCQTDDVKDVSIQAACMRDVECQTDENSCMDRVAALALVRELLNEQRAELEAQFKDEMASVRASVVALATPTTTTTTSASSRSSSSAAAAPRGAAPPAHAVQCTARLCAPRKSKR